MEKKGKNILTVLWYSHPRLSIGLLLITINLAVILLFTCILSLISGNGFLNELAYIFTFTMCSDGIYDFVNSNEDVACFIIKIVLVVTQMIIFSGSLIGFTTDLLQSTMDKTINNIGKINLEDHYVFLNWSLIGPRTIYDLSFLEGKKNIVILSDKDREEILNSIQSVFTENKRKMKNIKLFIKQGSPMLPKHLNDISLDKAKYIGVLLADSEDGDGMRQVSANDLNSIKTLFTMINIGIKANIVLEAENNDTLEKVENLLNVINPELSKRILVFSHNSVLGCIMGRSLVNSNFNSIYHELLSYDGVEFYTLPTEDIEEALYTYNDCIPIINYDNDFIDKNAQKSPDQLYVLSDNAQTLGRRLEKKSFVKPLNYRKKLEREGFSVFILSKNGDDGFVKQELQKYAANTNINITYKSYSYDDDITTIKDEINKTPGQKKVLLLSSEDNGNNAQDAEVFLTATDLKMSGFNKDVQIYAEIFNPSNMRALKNIGVASVIVSSKILSLFMVQLLTHPCSKKFYRDLISINDTAKDDMLDINIVKAKEMLEFNEESLSFTCQSELVQSFYMASGKTSMCIGIKQADGEENVRFLCNGMDKPENLTVYPNDELVLVTY